MSIHSIDFDEKIRKKETLLCRERKAAYLEQKNWGWLGEAKVSCISRHRGVELRLADSWARAAILAADKDRGGMFLFLLFLHFAPLFDLIYYLFYLSSPFLWEMTNKMPTRVDVLLNPNTIKVLIMNNKFVFQRNVSWSSILVWRIQPVVIQL